MTYSTAIVHSRLGIATAFSYHSTRLHQLRGVNAAFDDKEHIHDETSAVRVLCDDILFDECCWSGIACEREHVY